MNIVLVIFISTIGGVAGGLIYLIAVNVYYTHKNKVIGFDEALSEDDGKDYNNERENN